MTRRLSAAVIGTGIAGLACAWLLRHRYDVHVYERNDYIGGHTNTVTVEEDGRPVSIDTGFMVYNEATYPNLTRLFALLGVETMPAPMSFSVQHVPDGLEFSGKGINALFAQRRNIFRPRHYRLLKEISRFNATCTSVLDDPAFQDRTVGRYLEDENFSPDFRDHYLIPMSAAVWSSPPGKMLEFPVATLVRFFLNHRFLGLHGQHEWRTVAGGSRQYRDRMVADLQGRIHTARPAARVTREGGRSIVEDAGGSRNEYDYVILAAHADESLRMLGDATEHERLLLGKFSYQENIASLHTDESVMPRSRLAWSSWNYRVDSVSGGCAASTIYWMNSLQKVSKARNYFVSINDPGNIAPGKLLKTIVYHHPLFDREAVAAQGALPDLNKNGTRFFCGSYFRYGFHEDALNAALDVCALLKGGDPWG